MQNSNPSPAEVKAAAHKVGAWFLRLSDAVATHLENAAGAGVDPNSLLDDARDALVAQGLGKIQSANIVRLAVHTLNKKYGQDTYSESDLRAICERVATPA